MTSEDKCYDDPSKGPLSGALAYVSSKEASFGDTNGNDNNNDDEDSSTSKLKKFYAQYDISLDALLENNCRLPYRFVRLHPAFDPTETLKQLQAELPDNSIYPISVPWLDPSFGFYALPGDFRLAQSPTFQSARIYGQDVSSGAAVAALLTDYHDRQSPAKTGTTCSLDLISPSSWRILDLCCAPGLKLCAIADWLRQQQQQSSSHHVSDGAMVVGVDCSERRLAACRKIIQKHQIEPFVQASSSFEDKHEQNTRAAQHYLASGNVRIRLYQNDGTKFGQTTEPTKLVFDSTVASEERWHLGKRQRLNKSARARQKRRLGEMALSDTLLSLQGQTALADLDSNGEAVDNGSTTTMLKLFDRVIVDAECSTDGSLKHVMKQIAKQDDGASSAIASTSLETAPSKTNELTIPKLTDQQKLASLVNLQRELAASGFRLLKKGGVMVYSTCSFSDEQNEGVVQWLLDQHPSQARLVPLVFKYSNGSDGESGLIQEGSITGTIRFFPSLCSGGAETCDAITSKLTGGGFFLAKLKKL